jgi:hypothetical protein
MRSRALGPAIPIVMRSAPAPSGRAWNCAGSRPTATPARTFIYCAEALTYAFPDTRIVQVVRDGRDVVAAVAGW